MIDKRYYGVSNQKHRWKKAYFKWIEQQIEPRVYNKTVEADMRKSYCQQNADNESDLEIAFDKTMRERKKHPVRMTFEEFCAKYQALYDIPLVDYIRFRDIWTKKQKIEYNKKLTKIGARLNVYLDVGTFQGEDCPIVTYSYLDFDENHPKTHKLFQDMQLDFIAMIETELPSFKYIHGERTKASKYPIENKPYDYWPERKAFLFQEETTGYLFYLLPYLHYSYQQIGPVLTIAIDNKCMAFPEIDDNMYIVPKSYYQINSYAETPRLKKINMWNCIENIKAFYEKSFFRPYNPKINDVIIDDSMKKNMQLLAHYKWKMYQMLYQPCDYTPFQKYNIRQDSIGAVPIEHFRKCMNANYLDINTSSEYQYLLQTCEKIEDTVKGYDFTSIRNLHFTLENDIEKKVREKLWEINQDKEHNYIAITSEKTNQFIYSRNASKYETDPEYIQNKYNYKFRLHHPTCVLEDYDALSSVLHCKYQFDHHLDIYGNPVSDSEFHKIYYKLEKYIDDSARHYCEELMKEESGYEGNYKFPDIREYLTVDESIYFFKRNYIPTPYSDWNVPDGLDIKECCRLSYDYDDHPDNEIHDFTKE